MNENILKIGDEEILFLGFNKLENTVTFSFLPAGVAITDGNTKREPWNYVTKLSENRTINDPDLRNLLLDKNIPAKSYWANLNNTYHHIP